jgi:hypothetical protein
MYTFAVVTLPGAGAGVGDVGRESPPHAPISSVAVAAIANRKLRMRSSVLVHPGEAQLYGHAAVHW